MKNLILINLLIFLISVNATGLFGKSAKLKNLCKDSSFKINNTDVNSIYSIQKELKFDNLDSYLINKDAVFYSWSKNEDKILNMTITRIIYNKVMEKAFGKTRYKFDDIYLEDFIQNIPDHLAEFLSIKDEMNDHKDKEIYQQIIHTLERSLELIKLLLNVHKNELIEKLIKKDEFKNLLINLPVNKDRKLILGNDDVDKYYNEKIIKLDYLKGKKLLLKYTIYVPVNRKDYRPIPLFCYKSKSLPLFYKKN